MYFLKNRTTGQKPGFRDPGHENWHKSCQDGTEPYSERINFINCTLAAILKFMQQYKNLENSISNRFDSFL